MNVSSNSKGNLYSSVKQTGPKKRHILVIHVQNHPGVLNRVASLFRRRRFNIESISAGHTERPDVTRITIEADSSQVNTEQLEKQLNKLIEVIEIEEMSADSSIVREIALIKVARSRQVGTEALKKLLPRFSVKIVSEGKTSIVLEACDTPKKLDELIAKLTPLGLMELVRTGLAAMHRSH